MNSWLLTPALSGTTTSLISFLFYVLNEKIVYFSIALYRIFRIYLYNTIVYAFSIYLFMDLYAQLTIFYMQVLSIMESRKQAKQRRPYIMTRKLCMGEKWPVGTWIYFKDVENIICILRSFFQIDILYCYVWFGETLQSWFVLKRLLATIDKISTRILT